MSTIGKLPDPRDRNILVLLVTLAGSERKPGVKKSRFVHIHIQITHVYIHICAYPCNSQVQSAPQQEFVAVSRWACAAWTCWPNFSNTCYYHWTHCKHKIVGWDLLGRSKIYTDRTEIDIVVGSTCLRDKPIWGQIRQTMKVTTTRSRADSKSIFITWNPRLLLCRCILFCVVHVTSTRNHECTSKKNSTL